VDNHLHTLGYLLGAVVFAVGFLSTRIHSSLDSTIREVGERSRAVRQSLNEGDSLGPADLAELLGVVRSPTDYVAQGSRLFNWAIFVTSAVILADALYLEWHGDAEAPEHVLLVLVLLFAVTLAAVVFSEFEVRRVSVERQREISATTLGRLHELARLMAADDIVGASAELDLLRETFPTWGLLVEIEAYLDLLCGQPDLGLDQIESLVKGDSELHLSPVVGAACCLDLDGLDSALDLLARIEQRGGSERHPLLRRALAVSAGHLPALLASRDYLPATAPVEKAPARRVTQKLMGDEIERRREPVRDLGFDLNPATLRQTAPLMATLERWEGAGEPDDFEAVPALSGLLQLILDPGSGQPPAAVLQPRAEGCRDPLTLESFGFASLACGEPRTALRFFETAIHLAPAAGRSHWGRAIACYRVGWRAAALASLRRATTLTNEAPLLSLTQRLFKDPSTAIDPAEVEAIYPDGFDDMDRFEMALLGIEIPSPGGSSIQERFADGLIARALTARSAAVEAAA
jgi:hypothetical protein